MQMIEIAKAFSYDAKIVIMDEPTSSLTEKEVNHLFKIINKLKEKGCGIVYISHKMEEIFQLCDEITILRDGQWVATQPLKGMTMDQIIGMMVGRELTQRFPEKTNQPKEVILEVEHLTAKNQPSIKDVTFNLHKGEILGIAGLVGPSAPTSWRPCSASAIAAKGPSSCTARGGEPQRPRGDPERLRPGDRGAPLYRDLFTPRHRLQLPDRQHGQLQGIHGAAQR
jgi:ABC-type Na+ transport system ATPase subunit NatA